MFKKFQMWLYCNGYAALLIVVLSMIKRRRMSHNNGMTAVGKLRIVDNPTYPAHPFLKPGREFPCRLRHASVSYDDDTIIQVRAASLKFADSRWESPLDLQMNTGEISLFWSVRNFLFFFSCQEMTNGLAFARYYDRYPVGLAAAKNGIRRYPSSFAQMYYHSQTVQQFIGDDGVTRYCKFRLAPADFGPETGIIPLDELKNRWVETAKPGETLSQNYLKEEYAARVAQGPVRYMLQIQIHTPTPEDTDEIFNCSVAWDSRTHPFHNVAEVTTERVLTLDENNEMRFGLVNSPPSLSVIPATSIDDYNSVNYMRAKSGPAKRSRLFFYKIFGMPKPVPDARPPQPS